jgi:hypothetical protein
MKFRFNQNRIHRIVHARNAIAGALKDCNIEKSLFIDSIKKGWADIVGQLLASHSRPDRIYKNVLYIASDHPTYSNEISMLNSTILGKIKVEYGLHDLNDIRVEIKRNIWK